MRTPQICACQSRKDAMHNGEMAQDRFGGWHWPLDFVNSVFRLPQEANRLRLTHCPFCNDLLPNVSDAVASDDARPQMDVTDGGGDDAN